ncbi:MAG: PLP-dependent transferase [Actinobacteria bacterium]|nr:PLP-dependent transferase [Actinomycetota bacterium]MBV8396666.1 PLP-dependent transferase [Actinomycetota bacterium]
MEPDRSTIWPFDEAGEPRDFYYARYGHPTGAAAEARLGELEGGDALLYSSGMGAETAVLLAFAQPGSTVALAAGAYYGTSVLMRELGRWGLRLVEFDQTKEPPAADIVWVESPANPLLTEPDWDAVRAHPGLKVCDATVSTPVNLRALDHGVDVVLHSATKYLCGHHDALLGATVTRDADLTARLREVRGRTGIAAAPDAAASLLRGLDSLDERMARTAATARELARRLADHTGVENVRYPGYSGLISFDVADPRRVETRTRVIVNATSLGGVESTIESRHRWEGDRIPRGLVRLSVGLEDVDELWADLDHALA